ncbi:hypothetical protein AMAG_14290 [Allomyces macrogynus ATCC 38327]|uniref:Uncharacterized protein n=1 Tax=Allomyces macrogynus (strain ATCC 38327) TaxID=578462 RepID=A0A0L0T5B5_ALLM3|nr:hypothetical protein AMAG_14290 [Allomyces macrogynus ATCC 38327]|eukprot:KNE69749.1 hypothetical protein AMAG_14290 [Allomyces macrogynus ATCC 38327]
MGRHSALAIINGVVFLGHKYLRMKWDELKVKYFEYLQSPSDSVPRVLKMMWGKGPTPPRSKSSARSAMLSPYYESEDAASVHSGSENAALTGVAAAAVAHDLKRESSMSTLASAATQQQYADHPTMVLKMRARAAQQSQYEAELAAAAAAEGGEWHAGAPLPPPPMREAPPVPAAAPVRKLVPRIAMAGGRALPTGEDVAALEEVLRAVGLVVPDVGGASKSGGKE